MVTRTIELPGDKVEVHADIGSGRVVRALLVIEQAGEEDVQTGDPNDMAFPEWERLFEEMCALAPMNEHPADVSREAAYLTDEEIMDRGV